MKHLHPLFPDRFANSQLEITIATVAPSVTIHSSPLEPSRDELLRAAILLAIATLEIAEAAIFARIEIDLDRTC
jgi:hypothetical protein